MSINLRNRFLKEVIQLRNTELYHHGVKNQRWGVRRYQNKDGSLTELGRQRYGDRWDSMSDNDKKTAIKNSGNAHFVYAGRGMLNKNELSEAIDRIDLEQKIAKLHRGTRKSGADYIKMAADIVDSASTAYDTYQKANYLIGKLSGKDVKKPDYIGGKKNK